eukprot:9182535-Alexandrium_andersonii.AAC.1
MRTRQEKPGRRVSWNSWPEWVAAADGATAGALRTTVPESAGSSAERCDRRPGLVAGLLHGPPASRK